jgi:hypothetical protein
MTRPPSVCTVKAVARQQTAVDSWSSLSLFQSIHTTNFPSRSAWLAFRSGP